jgi:hypothetical protein
LLVQPLGVWHYQPLGHLLALLWALLSLVLVQSQELLLELVQPPLQAWLVIQS